MTTIKKLLWTSLYLFTAMNIILVSVGYSIGHDLLPRFGFPQLPKQRMFTAIFLLGIGIAHLCRQTRHRIEGMLVAFAVFILSGYILIDSLAGGDASIESLFTRDLARPAPLALVAICLLTFGFMVRQCKAVTITCSIGAGAIALMSLTGQWFGIPPLYGEIMGVNCCYGMAFNSSLLICLYVLASTAWWRNER